MSAIPHIAMQPVSSSQIAAIGHAPELNLLAIQFPPKRNGVSDVYHYENVSAELFAQFRAAESIGSFFIHNIKKHADKFPYSKMDPAVLAAVAPATPALSKELLAQVLNGRQTGAEITREEELQAKAAGLVVIFGASDDLMVLSGAIDDEASCYDGGHVLIDAKGALPAREDIDPDDDAALKDYFAREPEAKKIEALWCAEDDINWTYKTDVPHATFEVMGGDLVYCRGIVISVADLGGAA